MTDIRGTAPPDDEVSPIALLNGVLRHWKLFVMLPAVGLAVGLLAAVLVPPAYVANASFVTQDQGRSQLASGSLMEGLGLNLTRPGRPPEFYLALLRSREVLRATASTTYGASTPGVETGSLSHFVGDPGDEDSLQATVEWLRKAISVSSNGRTGLMDLEVTAPRAFLAEEIADRLLVLLNAASAEIQQTHAAAEATFVSGQLAAAKDSLEEAEAELGRFRERNRDFMNSPQLRLEQERLQRRVSNQNRLVGSLQESYYQAHIQGLRNTPSVAVVDPPRDSARRRRGNPLVRSGLGMIMGLFAALLVTAVLEIGRRLRVQDPSNYQELVRLSEGIRSDLKRPWRRSG